MAGFVEIDSPSRPQWQTSIGMGQASITDSPTAAILLNVLLINDSTFFGRGISGRGGKGATVDSRTIPGQRGKATNF